MENINSIRLQKLHKLKHQYASFTKMLISFFSILIFLKSILFFSANRYLLLKYFSKVVLLLEKPGYRKSHYYFSENDININKADNISIYRSTAEINQKHNFGQPFLTCGVSDHYLL